MENSSKITRVPINIGTAGQVTLYIYEDERDIAYIAALKVDPKFRRRNLGNILLTTAEESAKALFEAGKVRLKVLTGSPQHFWYLRKEYTKICEEKEYTWLEKDILV